MNRRYRVFVSSTYEDLKDERQRVTYALLESGYIPTGMELFPAANTNQWAAIKKAIDECDYYVLIIGGKYGSIGPDGISYTEMEYRYATEERRIPAIAFLHGDPDSLPGNKVEKVPRARRLLKEFRKFVKQRLCKYWSNSDQLSRVVTDSLNELKQTHPAPGWARGPIFTTEITLKAPDIRSNISRTIDVRRLPEGYPFQIDWPTLGKGIEILGNQLNSLQSTRIEAVVGINNCGMLIASFLSGYCDIENALQRPLVAIRSSSERDIAKDRDYFFTFPPRRKFDTVLVVDSEYKTGNSIRRVVDLIEKEALNEGGQIYLAVLAFTGIKEYKNDTQGGVEGLFRRSKYKPAEHAAHQYLSLKPPHFLAYITAGRVEPPGGIR
jgi:hypoxanthine phosphoribosyltransferase